MLSWLSLKDHVHRRENPYAMSTTEMLWNTSMRWYSGAHHKLAQNWPRIDNLCHMGFYYSFFATKKAVIYSLNTADSLTPTMLRGLSGWLPKAARDYMDLLTEIHSDIQQINGKLNPR